MFKTWEVIKALSENPKLKFKNHSNTIEIDSSTGIVVWSGRDKEPFILFSNAPGGVDNLHLRWTIAPEPVDFVTALKAFQDDKTIICEQEYLSEKKIYIGEYSDILEDQNGEAVSAKEILNGKWYIEE